MGEGRGAAAAAGGRELDLTPRQITELRWREASRRATALGATPPGRRRPGGLASPPSSRTRRLHRSDLDAEPYHYYRRPAPEELTEDIGEKMEEKGAKRVVASDDELSGGKDAGDSDDDNSLDGFIVKDGGGAEPPDARRRRREKQRRHGRRAGSRPRLGGGGGSSGGGSSGGEGEGSEDEEGEEDYRDIAANMGKIEAKLALHFWLRYLLATKLYPVFEHVRWLVGAVGGWLQVGR